MKRSMVFAAAFLVGISASALPSQPNGADRSTRAPFAQNPFLTGIELFHKGDYPGAIQAFKKARELSPSKPDVYLWLGLAYVATGEKSMAHNTWLKMPAERQAMTLSMYFKGLAEWKDGKTNEAKYWFQNTSSYPETKAAALSKQALTQMSSGKAAPPVSQWPALASLSGANTTQAGPAPSTEKKPETKRPAALPTGTYQCYDMYTEQNNPTRTTYKEKLVIKDKSTYVYQSGKSTSGNYTYNAATGAITFTSGPYAGSNLKASFGYRAGDNKPMITLSYSFKNLGTDDDFCVLVKQ